MQVTVTLTFGSEAEAAAFLSGKEVPAKPPKPAGTDKPAASSPSATPAPTPTVAPEKAPTPAPSPVADVTDYAKSGLPELTQQAVAKDRAAVIAVLGKYGVKKAGELKVDQYEAYRADVQAILTPGGDLS